MINGIRELAASCNHVNNFGFGVNDSVQADTSSRNGRIALVAIGNPLVEADSWAIELIELLKQRSHYSGICFFVLDGNFAWLGEVVKRHDSVIILDSISTTDDSKDGVLTIPLTGDVIERSGFAIRATHGLSWLDEIKLYALDSKLPDRLMFFGIESVASSKNDKDVRLENSMNELLRLIEKCINANEDRSAAHA